MGGSKTFMFFFLGCGLGFCSKFPLHTYYYVNQLLSWTEAQQYCRVNYDDLATFESISDIRLLSSSFTYVRAWTGLNDNPNSWKFNMGNDSNSWRWSETGKTSTTGYQNWTSSQPNSTGANENCVVMVSSGQWDDVSCNRLNSFICSSVTNQNTKIYEFISTLSTWTSAQTYCRQMYTDLTTISNSDENEAVYSVKPPTTDVWIGLYRVPWTWSDKSPSSYRRWLSTCPNNYYANEFCVIENTLHNWDDVGCNLKYPFICHRVSKLKIAVRMKITTDADRNYSAINADILQKLGAVLRSQGWTNLSLHWNIQPQVQQ